MHGLVDKLRKGKALTMGDLRRILAALKRVRAGVSDSLPLRYLEVLLYVYEKGEGVPLNQVCKDLNLAPSVASKAVEKLADGVARNPKTKQMEKVGLGLLNKERDPYNQRCIQITITQKGLELLHDIQQILAG